MSRLKPFRALVQQYLNQSLPHQDLRVHLLLQQYLKQPRALVEYLQGTPVLFRVLQRVDQRLVQSGKKRPFWMFLMHLLHSLSRRSGQEFSRVLLDLLQALSPSMLGRFLQALRRSTNS